jgi:hypothetical protein
MLGGVSQQPDSIKLPGQVREAINVYLDPTFGCRKRPGTSFVGLLADDIPETAKWFPIFRDANEKYVVAIYRDDAEVLNLRVWDAQTGVERTVVIADGAGDYFEGSDLSDIKHQSIGDYTLIANPNKVVSMGGGGVAAVEEAFVVISSAGYNTTYSIDLTNDGASEQTKVYRASKLEVIPGSYEVQDAGVCLANGAESFSIDHETDPNKVDLQFRISNVCSSYLKKITNYKITGLTANFPALTYTTEYNYATRRWESVEHDPMDPYYDQTVSYTAPGGDFIQYKFTKSTVNGYTRRSVVLLAYSNDDKLFKTGSSWVCPLSGVTVSVSGVSGKTTEAYVSRYNCSIILNNGGSGWRVGDIVTATVEGKEFQVKVTEEAFSYVYASDGTATYTTPQDATVGTLSIDDITQNLVTDINAIDNYVADSTGNVIRIRRDDGRSFNVSTRSGAINSAMSVVKGTALDIASLPTQCWDGTVIKVVNTDKSGSDDYYVKFNGAAEGIPGAGNWLETVSPGIPTDFNSSTLPHALVRLADGSFEFGPLGTDSEVDSWKPREVGDVITNPDPSFVGSTIQGMFFYFNRLAFLTKDTVVLSRPGDYFNFWTNSALAASDADPIDMGTSSSSPSTLKAAAVTAKGVVIFSDSGQYLLKTEEANFAPDTAEIKSISSYAYQSSVPPMDLGVSLFFVTSADSYSKILEMSIDSLQGRPVVADDTRIVPKYIPRNLSWGASSATNDLAVFGSGDRCAYAFKFFNQAEERKLAGWCKWELPESIKLMSFQGDVAYIVQQSPSGLSYLATMELVDDPTGEGLPTANGKALPRLDNICYSDDLTVSDDGKVYLPDGAPVNSGQACVVFTEGDYTGLVLYPDTGYDEEEAAYYVTIEPEQASSTFVVGYTYTMQVTLPSFYVTSEGRADRVFAPIVETINLAVEEASNYTCKINRLGYDQYIHEVELLLADSYEADSSAILESGEAVIPVFSKGDDVLVTVESAGPTSSAITSYSWQGHYNNRGITQLR